MDGTLEVSGYTQFLPVVRLHVFDSLMEMLLCFLTIRESLPAGEYEISMSMDNKSLKLSVTVVYKNLRLHFFTARS